MKKKIPYILTALLVVTQIYSLSRIKNLENQIINANNTINNVNSDLSWHINSIYSNVDKQLKEQASLIQSASAILGEFDVNTTTIPIDFTIEPKQVSDNMMVFLEFDDETIQLEKQNTTYKGRKIFHIFENEIHPKIIIEDNGLKTKTQDEALSIYGLVSQFIPRLYPIQFGTSVTSSPNSDIVKYELNDPTIMDGNYKDFKKVQFVTYIDGEKTNEITLDLSKYNEEEPIIQINEILELEIGQILTTYLVAIDNLDFTHYYPLEHYEAGSDVQREPYFDIVRITNKNGKIIYDNTLNGNYPTGYVFETDFATP
ncbi:MAG: hypothetical protein R3Y63_14640 [Eubacteriales bacterium]